jgi:hypothetical protein
MCTLGFKFWHFYKSKLRFDENYYCRHEHVGVRDHDGRDRGRDRDHVYVHVLQRLTFLLDIY